MKSVLILEVESTVPRMKTLLIAVWLVACLLPAFGCNRIEPEWTPIYAIQGAGHFSPLNGQIVETRGVVTVVAPRGFYLQDAKGDGNASTSDAIFVFTRSPKPPESRDNHPLEIGDDVLIRARVSEWIPGGSETGNLSMTQLVDIEYILVVESDTLIPQPIVIGRSGRVPPGKKVISSDEIKSPINLQRQRDDAQNRFNPSTDGIDFFESLESMLVKVEDPVAISPLQTHSPKSSEFYALANNGADVVPADARTARGGILLQPHPENRGDQNPERVKIRFPGPPLYDNSRDVPSVSVGDRMEDIAGVVGYSFGNYEVKVIRKFAVYPSKLVKEVTHLAGDEQHVTIASYNVLNLSPLPADDKRRSTLARHIVDHLRSPDIVALQEIQDNDGTSSNRKANSAGQLPRAADADETLQSLADSIVDAGGPTYRFFDVDPISGTAGGAPGGNIRNAFLYNSKRVELLDYTALTEDVLRTYDVSDRRAFLGARAPLLATFKFNGARFVVINNHLSSRFGSTPIFGSSQPFVQAGESRRNSQVTALNQVVNRLVQHSASTPVVVLGDLNTFEFSDDLSEKITVKTGSQEKLLRNLIGKLSDRNVYTYNFEGNSQVLDHMFVTNNVFDLAEFDIVHVNVDFPQGQRAVGSDHEPIVARLRIPPE